jgi:hypothetical protein
VGGGFFHVRREGRVRGIFAALMESCQRSRRGDCRA